MSTFNWPVILSPSGIAPGYPGGIHLFTSPYSGYSQGLIQPGAHWTLQLDVPADNHRQSGALASLIARLERGDFVRVPAWWAPGIGTRAGNPYVLAVSSGDSISTSGWAGSQMVLGDGDLISANDQLFLVIGETHSSASGAATVEVYPPIRQAMAINTQIEAQTPAGLFRWSGSQFPRTEPIGCSDVSMQLREVVQ